MKRNKFSRNAVASSRGSYVRKSHYMAIKEQLHNRNVEADLNDIIEASIILSFKVKPTFYVKIFGKLLKISEEEAAKLEPSLIIKL